MFCFGDQRAALALRAQKRAQFVLHCPILSVYTIILSFPQTHKNKAIDYINQWLTSVPPAGLEPAAHCLEGRLTTLYQKFQFTGDNLVTIVKTGQKNSPK